MIDHDELPASLSTAWHVKAGFVEVQVLLNGSVQGYVVLAVTVTAGRGDRRQVSIGLPKRPSLLANIAG